ncbi:MAG: hypothetical protein LRS46_03215 [Desulfurococcales archaeon]|nr:hypothetical protein [Desulfurococcales archaeon]
MEDIPLFHLAPGGSAMRVLTPASLEPPLRCPESCGVLYELTTSYGSEFPVSVPCRDLLSLASKWRVDVLSIEGIEPLGLEGVEELISKAREAGFLVAVRSQGLYLDSSLKSGVDAVVFDYVGTLTENPFYKVKALSSLDSLLMASLSLEVVAYMREPVVEAIVPLVERMKENAALHIFIEDPKGGGPAREVYETALKKHSYTYLHSPPYDRLDTYCPKCGALIAVREDSKLVALKTREGRCWRCGHPLPFRGPLYERTKPTILRRTGGGGVRWHDPRVVATTS